MRRIRTIFRVILRACVFLACAGCSGSAPEILNVDWRIVVERGNSGTVKESLSLFCAVNDDDGFGDIEFLYIIRDSEQLFWELTNDTWRSRTIDGQVWIGSESLEHPGGGAFPRGSYRVIVIDKGGDRQEQSVQIQTIATENLKPPRIFVNGETLSIASSWPENSVIFHDRSGTAIKAAGTNGNTMTLSEAWGSQEWKREVFSVSLLGYDEKTKTAGRSDMVETSRVESIQETGANGDE